jgi:hypothetical protein
MRDMKPLIALIAVASVAMVAGWQSRPDFSGRWVAEAEVVPSPAAPGTPGTPPAPPPRGSMGSGWGSPITISQDAKQLVVEHQIFSRYDLQPPLRYVYALDGTESQYSIMVSHTTQVRRSRATWKGEALEITTRYPATDPGTGKSFTVEVTQRLFLESPTTLVVEVTRPGAFGGRPTTSRAVYKKG